MAADLTLIEGSAGSDKFRIVEERLRAGEADIAADLTSVRRMPRTLRAPRQPLTLPGFTPSARHLTSVRSTPRELYGARARRGSGRRRRAGAGSSRPPTAAPRTLGPRHFLATVIRPLRTPRRVSCPRKDRERLAFSTVGALRSADPRLRGTPRTLSQPNGLAGRTNDPERLHARSSISVASPADRA